MQEYSLVVMTEEELIACPTEIRLATYVAVRKDDGSVEIIKDRYMHPSTKQRNCITLALPSLGES